MENVVDVSVIILTYYHEEYITKAVNSVLQQNFRGSYEILIADDSSMDNTLSLINELKALSPNVIRVIEHKENVGTCKNLYDAFLEARGRYIVIMAGDDVFADCNKLEKQYAFLEDERNALFVAVTTAIKHVYPDGEETGESFPNQIYRDREITKKMFLNGVNYPDQGIMFRNIFCSSKAKEQFSLLYKFSKLIEDLTLNFFLFDYGKIYLLGDETYALTVRREENENQHNYNSIRNKLEKVTDHITLLNNISCYYGKKYNLQKRYSPYIGTIISMAVKSFRPSYLKYLKGIPATYIIPSCCDYIKTKRRLTK